MCNEFNFLPNYVIVWKPMMFSGSSSKKQKVPKKQKDGNPGYRLLRTISVLFD